jgi:hypothetical protein
MTYIIGTTFTVARKVVRPGVTNISNKVTASTPILPPGTYTINNIKRADGNVIYTFVNENLEQVNVEFNDMGQADRYISAMRNEQLPDYETIYKKLR